MRAEIVEHDAEYLIERIFVIATEYKFVMGTPLDDRIEGFLNSHGVPISTSQLFSDGSKTIPLTILKDLSQEMWKEFEAPRVTEMLREFPPDYSQCIRLKSFDLGVFEEEFEDTDDCEDF